MVEDEGYLTYLRQVFDLPAPPPAVPINRPAPLLR